MNLRSPPSAPTVPALAAPSRSDSARATRHVPGSGATRLPICRPHPSGGPRATSASATPHDLLTISSRRRLVARFDLTAAECSAYHSIRTVMANCACCERQLSTPPLLSTARRSPDRLGSPWRGSLITARSPSGGRLGWRMRRRRHRRSSAGIGVLTSWASAAKTWPQATWPVSGSWCSPATGVAGVASSISWQQMVNA